MINLLLLYTKYRYCFVLPLADISSRPLGLWILPRPDKSRRNYLAASFVWSYGCEDVSTAQRRGLSHALRLASSTGRVLILPRFRCCPYSKRPRNKKPVPSATGNMGCANELAECSLMHVLNIAVLVFHSLAQSLTH